LVVGGEEPPTTATHLNHEPATNREQPPTTNY